MVDFNYLFLFDYFLMLISWPFRLFVACRNLIFDREWISYYFSPVPVVISIRNIVVSGGGVKHLSRSCSPKNSMMNFSLASLLLQPIIATNMEVVSHETISGDSVSFINGKKVGIFCGIAHPEYFQKTVLQQGAEIVDTAFTSDHLILDYSTLEAFALECKEKGAEMLLCTEKDKVKIDEGSQFALPIVWLKMRLKLVEGGNERSDFFTRVKTDLRDRIW